MKIDENSIGERVSEVLRILKKNKKIQGNKDLINESGFKTIQSITEIVKNRQAPPTQFLNVLSGTYGVNIDYILRGKHPVFSNGNDESFVDEKTTLKEEGDHTATFAEMVATNKLHAEARLLEAKNNKLILELIKINSDGKTESLQALSAMRKHFLELLSLRDLKDGKFQSIQEARRELDRMLYEVEVKV